MIRLELLEEKQRRIKNETKKILSRFLFVDIYVVLNFENSGFDLISSSLYF
jgi:hypothetical protein